MASEHVLDQFVSVQAGAGNDSVVNEAVLFAGSPSSSAPAPTTTSAPTSARASTARWTSELPRDSEPDLIETRGGRRLDHLRDAGRSSDRDVIATGADRDYVTFLGAAGGSLDNGPDPDTLRVTDKWEGDLAVDNVTRRATIGDSTVLTWTAVDTFSMRATRRGGSPSSAPTPSRSTSLNTGQDLAAPSQITTGGGDDSVWLRAYLPASVDLGEGVRLALVRGLSPGLRRARRLGGMPHHRRA